MLKAISENVGLKSAVYNQERFQIKSGLKCLLYGTYHETQKENAMLLGKRFRIVKHMAKKCNERIV